MSDVNNNQLYTFHFCLQQTIPLLCRSWGSHSSAAEDISLPGYDALDIFSSLPTALHPQHTVLTTASGRWCMPTDGNVQACSHWSDKSLSGYLSTPSLPHNYWPVTKTSTQCFSMANNTGDSKPCLTLLCLYVFNTKQIHISLILGYNSMWQLVSATSCHLSYHINRAQSATCCLNA